MVCWRASNVGGGYHPDGLANEALHWVVEKAEGLGLEFDTQYLLHYRPCFNSVLQDSMSWMYKIMGPYQRPLGTADNKAEHQSVLDRVNFSACKYDPPNVREYVTGVGKGNTVNTIRIARGTPC